MVRLLAPAKVGSRPRLTRAIAATLVGYFTLLLVIGCAGIWESVFAFEPGDCIDSTLPEGETIYPVFTDKVSCDGPWQYRVLNNFTVDASETFPGEHFFLAQARTECHRSYTFVLYPDIEGWKSGDTTVNCLQESFGFSQSDPAKLERLVSSVKPGECFNQVPESNLAVMELVSCSGEWEYKVLKNVTVPPDTIYPGNALFETQEVLECGRHSTIFLPPDQETWNYGDTSVNCLQESFGFSQSDPAKLERLVSSVKPGECFNEVPESNLAVMELVSCSGEWEFRVLQSFTVTTESTYPGDVFFEIQAALECDRYFSTFMFPDAGAWDSGGRVVDCLQESFGLSKMDPNKLSRLVLPNSLESFECFNENPESDYRMVELVRCSGRWDFRVASTFELDIDSPYPEDSFINDEILKRCGPNDWTFSPSRETWEFGDRSVVCFVDG